MAADFFQIVYASSARRLIFAMPSMCKRVKLMPKKGERRKNELNRQGLAEPVGTFLAYITAYVS